MIDWSQVAELRDAVGAEDFPEVAEVFLEEVEEVIARLQDAPDLTQLEADLHFLKGSALNLGFADFSNLCQAGETMAAGGHADTVDIAPIIQTFNSSKDAFLAGLE